MGVQLPGPDEASFEQGFTAPGEDMHWQAPRGTDVEGVQMPFGAPEQEAGWLSGEDMRGVASSDPAPQGPNMGAVSGEGLASEGLARSAGYHMFDSFEEMYAPVSGLGGGEQNGTGLGPSMAGLPVGSIPDQGYPNAGAGQGGVDSMEGLGFYGGPAPQGLQDSYNSGPGVIGNGAEPGGDEQSAVGR